MVIPSARAINLATQQLKLRSLFPRARTRIQRSELSWEADITPTPLSEVYRVGLTYKLGEPPDVHVFSPKLERLEKCPLPHVYKGEMLCLYLPRAGEWRADKFLALTIVPWTSEWLANYEVWRATGGVWCGGGTSHPK